MEIMLLNLDRSQDRLDHFRSVNRHLTRVTRVRAIDGRALDRDALVRDGTIDANLPYTAGAIGCALSHGKLWTQAVTENRPLTIAEDDALFSYFFSQKSRSFLTSIDDDWDFVLWGYGFQNFIWVDPLQGTVPIEIRLTEDHQKKHISTFQFTDTLCTLMRLIHAFGYVCYSISPRGAGKLLKRCFPLRQELIPFCNGIVIHNEGVDCVANSIYSDMKSYICVAPLVITENRMPSTIR